jgi:glutamine amidotransferase
MKSKKVAIFEAGGANFSSVFHALQRLGCNPVVTKSLADLKTSDAVILPGVGSAGRAMGQLRQLQADDFLKKLQMPILGICLGQQLLCDSSEEDDTTCLGIIPLQVRKLKGPRIIPHMGWNYLVEIEEDEPLFTGIDTSDNFYFIHSYAAELVKPFSIGVADYLGAFSAVIRRDNFYGVQFHPEKSGVSGLKILKNFLEINV